MLRACLLVAFGAFAHAASAQNAAAGKLYYETPVMGATCAEAGCHGPNPLANTRNVRAGANNPAAILNAVDTRPQMAVYRGRITAQNAADLAAYIANPAAAGPAPTTPNPPTADGTTLTFGQTQVGTPNMTPMPASVTITNPGMTALMITGIAVGGANASEFTPAGTCVGAAVTVNAGQTCTLTASFLPTAAGTRMATFTLVSNAATNPTINLTGTAAGAAVPSLGFSQTALLFNAQTLGTTSGARLIGVTNNSTMPVSISATTATPNAEFVLSGSGCVTTLAPGSSCTMELRFVPAAAGARTGELVIASNATGAPHKVALSGTGVTTPTGQATVALSALSFPSTPVAERTAPQMALLTNTGNAALTITAVALTGPNADDFKFGVNNSCLPGTLDVDATCRLEAEFRPVTGGGDKTAAIEVTTSVGKASLALTGTVPSGSATPATGPTPTAPPVRATTQSLLRPSNEGAGAVPWAGLLVLLGAAGLRRRLRG